MRSGQHLPDYPDMSHPTTYQDNRLWGLFGVLAGTLGVLGHFLLPGGFPENGDGSQMMTWILDNAASIRMAAALGIIGGLSMIIYSQVVGSFLHDAGRRSPVATSSTVSVGACAAVLTVGYIMISVASWADSVSDIGQVVWVPTLLNIGIHLAVSAWVIALPAAFACTTLLKTNRVIGIFSILATAAIGLSVLLPAVSWFPGALWFVIVGVAISLTAGPSRVHPTRTTSTV